MGKKKQASNMGRAIIKDRFGKKNKTDGDTFLHTSELNDGYDWGRLNLQSVTEQNNLEDFLTTAEMAGTEFTAEKLNIQFIPRDTTGLPGAEELDTIKDLHKEHRSLLKIPRRPAWTTEMAASEVDHNEKMAFLDWRRSLATLQEVEGLVMTPYEKNLEFWRQLWRVIEKSDVVVQIVDARNPLLFYCADLETYVAEVDPSKLCVVLINKADFLTKHQREVWCQYFTRLGVRIAFWSAKEETERQEELDKAAKEEMESGIDEDKDDESESGIDDDSDGDDYDDDDELSNDDNNIADEVKKVVESVDNSKLHTQLKDIASDLDFGCSDMTTEPEVAQAPCSDLTSGPEVAQAPRVRFDVDKDKMDVDSEGADKTGAGVSGIRCTCEHEFHERDNVTYIKIEDASVDSVNTCSKCGGRKKHGMIENSPDLYFGPQLLDFFRSLHLNKENEDSLTKVGMVGYPNVGKSSTINAILKMKKVPVSATPGRTKHFQTLFVDPTLMLCDCPGLVFPSFVMTKAELVVSGILPIDQMRDHVPPSSLICQHIPRAILETTYGVIIPRPGEGEDPTRVPTSEEFLNAYGAMRGFMTQRGIPDCPRSSRFVLKDYVNGKLLYVHPPPDFEDPVQFNNYDVNSETQSTDNQTQEGNQSGMADVPTPSKIDKDFFQKDRATVHARTARGGILDATCTSVNSPHSSTATVTEKPWKKHNNRRKKEKLRRVYGHLDV